MKFVLPTLIIVLLIVGFYFIFPNVSFFTVVNARANFNPAYIVADDDNFRCLSYPSFNIPVNFKLSSPPDSSLKSVDFGVAASGELFASSLESGNCFMVYSSESALMPGVVIKSDNLKDVKRCAATVSCIRNLPDGSIDTACSNKGFKANPFCPVVFYDSFEPALRVKQGVVVFDSHTNQWVCRDDNPIIPYKCYSNVCGGIDLIVSDAQVCVAKSSSSQLAYDAVFNSQLISNDDAKGSFWSFVWFKINSFFIKLFG